MSFVADQEFQTTEKDYSTQSIEAKTTIRSGRTNVSSSWSTCSHPVRPPHAWSTATVTWKGNGRGQSSGSTMSSRGSVFSHLALSLHRHSVTRNSVEPDVLCHCRGRTLAARSTRITTGRRRLNPTRHPTDTSWKGRIALKSLLPRPVNSVLKRSVRREWLIFTVYVPLISLTLLRWMGYVYYYVMLCIWK